MYMEILYDGDYVLTKDGSKYFGKISPKTNRLFYTKRKIKKTPLSVESINSTDSDFYNVKAGMISRDSYLKNKKPLWVSSQSG